MKQPIVNRLLLIFCCYFFGSANVFAQKNEIVFTLDKTPFNLTSSESDHVSKLLEINYLDEQDVLKIVKSESGLLCIIQSQAIYTFDGKSIIAKQYFDHNNENIKDAFFIQDKLILIGNGTTIGRIQTRSKQFDQIEYDSFPDHYKLYTYSDKTFHCLVSSEDDTKEIYKANLGKPGDIQWDEVHSIKTSDTITHFHLNKIANEFIYVTTNDKLIYENGTETNTYSPNEVDTIYSPRSKIIPYEDSYFVFFNNAKGIYWLNKKDLNQLSQISNEGTYLYHNYDDSKGLLIALAIRAMIANSIIHISNNTIQYIDQDLDVNISHDVLSADFSAEQLVSSRNGIYQVSNNFGFVPGIKKHLHNKDKLAGEYGEIITDIETHENIIYAVSERDGRLYKKENSSFELIHESDLFFHKLTSDTIHNTLWISAYNEDREGSLYRLKNDKIEEELKTDIIIRKVMYHSKNTLLLFGFRKIVKQNYGVIYKYNIKDKSITELFSKKGYDIWCAVRVYDKIICGTNNTLFQFDEETNSIREIKELQGQRISAIRNYNDTLYICTRSNGIYLLGKDLTFFEHLNFAKKPISNKITDITKDFKGNYWLTTFKSVALLNENHEFLMRLSYRDGLSSSEFNSFSNIIQDSSIYAGSINGITEINTREFYENANNLAKLYNMKALYKNDYFQPQQDSDKYFYNFVPQNIVFEAYQSNMTSPEANYVTLEVKKNNKIVPIEHQNNLVKIDNLKRGQYDIYQRTITNDKIKINEIHISQNYNKLINNILLALLIGLIGYLFARFINHREKKILIEKNELENRLVSIKLESLRSQLNPHFVFNCLNSIQYYIQMNEKVLARDYLSKFSKLMRYFLESSRNDKINITDEINLLELYLELEKLRFEQKFEYTISSSLNEDIKIPTMIVQPHVENSIVHGISHLENRIGKIDIQFTEIESGVLCTVIDNGIGREAANQLNIKKKKKHKSRATQIIQERMAILNDQGKGNANISYTDKRDNQGNITGTIASIKFTQNGIH